MSPKEVKLLAYKDAQKEAEGRLLAASLPIDQPNVWQVLIEHFGCYDVPTDIIFKDLDARAIFEIVIQYYQDNGIPQAHIQLPSSEQLYDLDRGRIEKANIQLNGTVWVVYANDKDPFPSNPHAHDYSRGLKLHLGTGELFQGKKPFGPLPKKEFQALKDEIERRLPKLNMPK